MITAAQVKELREKTGAGMMDCKKVLTETDGDMEKAIELHLNKNKLSFLFSELLSLVKSEPRNAVNSAFLGSCTLFKLNFF